ncbi:MAG: hypothetical protein ACK553_17850 [Planctomycetota bacterium]
MGIKDFFKRLTRKHQSVGDIIRKIASDISKQDSGDDRLEFMSMIYGMIDAGEIELAIHSLRTKYDEQDCDNAEIENQLKNLEEEFGDKIKRLLNP